MTDTEPTDVDREVWETAYRAHADRLTRLATVLVGRDAAHDLVADTVLACIRHQSWSDVENPGAYLARALVNAASSRRRSDGARRAREVRAALLATPVVPPEGQHEPTDLTPALDVLSPTQAAIVFLLYWEDQTIASTARQLDMSEGAVRKQLDRAKRRLRGVINHATDR